MNALLNEKELSLTELAAVLESDSKLDYAVPANHLSTWFSGENDEETRMSFPVQMRSENLPLTGYAADQLHSRLAPGLKSFSDHLRSNRMHETYQRTMRDVLDRTNSTFRVRTLLNDNLPERHARAVVSDKYKPIDDDVVFGTALPMVADSGRFQAIGGNKTDIRTACKFVERTPFLEINSGGRNRIFSLGFIMQNSEVGAGSASFSMFVTDHFCMNGCIFSKFDLAHVAYRHIGSRIDIRSGLIESSTVERAELASIQRLICEATTTAMSLSGEEKIKEMLLAASSSKVERTMDADFFVDVGKALKLTSKEAEELPLYAYNDEATKLGIQAAVTALAQTKPYERRLELEAAGGNILSMSDRQWSALAAA